MVHRTGDYWTKRHDKIRDGSLTTDRMELERIVKPVVNRDGIRMTTISTETREGKRKDGSHTVIVGNWIIKEKSGETNG